MKGIILVRHTKVDIDGSTAIYANQLQTWNRCRHRAKALLKDGWKLEEKVSFKNFGTIVLVGA